MSTNLLNIISKLFYYFVVTFFFLGIYGVCLGQNIACVSTLNVAGNSYQGINLSSVFSLGEVITGSANNNGQYVVIGIIKFDRKLTTNLKEESKLINVEVFPNPVMDRLQISMDEEIYHYRVFNSLGQIVLNGREIRDKYIEVSSLVTGTYMLQIAYGDIGYQSVSWLIKL